MNELFLSVADLAKRYGVSRQTIFNYLRNKDIPQGLKIGKIRRWPIEKLKEWEDSQCN